MPVLSVERDLRAHGDGALRRHRPQLGASPIAGRPPDQLERRGVEERSARLRGVGAHGAAGIVVAREVEEEAGSQRTVHNEAGIALSLHGPAAIVVDAVAVEREGGEPEEEHGVGNDAAAPRHAGGRSLATRRLVAIARLHFLAEDGAPLLLESETRGAEDAAHHGGEHESARATALHADVSQLRLAPHALAEAERLM